MTSRGSSPERCDCLFTGSSRLSRGDLIARNLRLNRIKRTRALRVWTIIQLERLRKGQPPSQSQLQCSSVKAVATSRVVSMACGRRCEHELLTDGQAKRSQRILLSAEHVVLQRKFGPSKHVARPGVETLDDMDSYLRVF